ncbi:MAG: hypothetical protein PHO94_06530 [Petrimonas sp.]|nr:hypothetical protein [Petrimonas sp.]
MKYLFFLWFAFLCVSCNQRAEDYEKAVAMQEKAVLFMQNEVYGSALYYLEEAIRLDRTYYLPYQQKANIYIKLHDTDKAIDASKKAVSVKPDFAEGWTYLGLLYKQEGDKRQSAESLEKSILLYDKRLVSLTDSGEIAANKLNKAWALMLLGKEPEAKAILQELTSLNEYRSVAEALMNMNGDELMK